MKTLTTLLLTLLVLGGCSDYESFDEDVSFRVTCKFNLNALYEDRLTFNKEITSVKRTSTNRNTEDAVYKVKQSGENLILNGTRTVIDINKNKQLIPDSDLFVMVKTKNEKWKWMMYYADDFEEDPVRFMMCYEV